MDVKEGEKRDSYLRKKRGFGIQPKAVANEDDVVIGVECYIEYKLEKKTSLPTVTQHLFIKNWNETSNVIFIERERERRNTKKE